MYGPQKFKGGDKCYMEDKIVNRDGICKVEDDKNTIKPEQWDNEPTDTFFIDGNKLTMNENSGVGLCGTYDKQ